MQAQNMADAIYLENVSYLREGKVILDHIDWQVPHGENWVMLGLNGSGKTTLLNLLNGYIFPSNGKAEVLGYRFGRASIPELRTHIGWISSALQQNIPPHDTPLNIVLSGKFASLGLWEHVTGDDTARAYAILEQLRIGTLAKRRYSTLSQGERQKVMIGRALMNDPQMLIFDEAFSGLGIFARRELEEIINALAQGEQTVIFVTHNTDEILSTFRKALLLRDGAIYAKGDVEDVITQERLRDFYGHDIDVFSRNGRFYMSIQE